MILEQCTKLTSLSIECLSCLNLHNERPVFTYLQTNSTLIEPTEHAQIVRASPSSSTMAEEGVPIQLGKYINSFVFLSLGDEIFSSVYVEIGYLKDIVNALSESNFSRSRWLPLGLQLGLIQPTLKDIGAMCNEDPEKCLCECLTCWLKGADKVNESGGPTVESLATALNKIGDGLAAARTTELLSNEMSL